MPTEGFVILTEGSVILTDIPAKPTDIPAKPTDTSAKPTEGFACYKLRGSSVTNRALVRSSFRCTCQSPRPW